jgi:hypothetical protein
MNNLIGRVVIISLGIFLGVLSVFFAFYTARLLYVTHGLQLIRAGGQGAYIGAVVFPILALVCGFGAWRCLRAANRA